jgi:hypothetical protein
VITVTARLLDATAGDPVKTALALGPLEPWIHLADGTHRPRLPTEPGTAVVLFAGRGAPPLARGFALPVQWVPATAVPSSGLPEAIDAVADTVRTALGLPDWTLVLHPSLRPRTIDPALPVSAGSAALPLALALALVADHHMNPGPSLLATGGIDAHGRIATVDGYEHKVALAAKLMHPDDGGRRWLAVPASDVERCRGALERHGIEPLPIVPHPDLRASLAPALARLGAEPGPDADAEALCVYGNAPLLRADRSRRGEFYRKRLVEPIGTRLRSTLEPALRRTERLLLPVSEAADNALLSLYVYRPRRVMLIATERATQTRAVEVVEGLAGTLGCACERLDVRVEGDATVSPGDVHRAAEFLAGAMPAVVDITPGTRELTALCVTAARATGAAVVYVKMRHDGGVPLFGTERVLRFPDLTGMQA